MSSELQSHVRFGGAIWWMLTRWRPYVVDWGGGLFAGCLRRVQLFVSTCNGRLHLALQNHWLLPINYHFDDCKARLVRSGFPV